MDDLQSNINILEDDEQDELDKPSNEEIDENLVVGEGTNHKKEVDCLKHSIRIR